LQSFEGEAKSVCLLVVDVKSVLIDYKFTVLHPAQEFFHLYGDVTIADEGLQNLGLCSALRAFEQGGTFIVPHLQ
jgi:uncharacterized protein (DUF952 family)